MTYLLVELTALIRAKIKVGRIPSSPNARVFASRGAGYPCSCCGRSIGGHESEYELECHPLDENALCVMHRNCYLQWREIVGMSSGRCSSGREKSLAPCVNCQ